MLDEGKIVFSVRAGDSVEELLQKIKSYEGYNAQGNLVIFSDAEIEERLLKDNDEGRHVLSEAELLPPIDMQAFYEEEE